MWLVFGIAAVITAVLNVVWILRKRRAKWFRFASLSFTAFTLCSFLTKVNGWVSSEDWSALMDVLPAASEMMWVLTFASIVINGISLFADKASRNSQRTDS